jgi:hypothetical protein
MYRPICLPSLHQKTKKVLAKFANVEYDHQEKIILVHDHCIQPGFHGQKYFSEKRLRKEVMGGVT